MAIHLLPMIIIMLRRFMVLVVMTVMIMIVYDADDGDEHLKHRELTKGKLAGSFHLRECRTKEGQAVFLL